MGLVIKLQYKLNGQCGRVTGHDVKVLALNAVEGILSHAFIHSAFYFYHICKSNLTHESILAVNGLLKHQGKTFRQGRKKPGLSRKDSPAVPCCLSLAVLFSAQQRQLQLQRQ
ncbi:MAG TPA: hypothetical protein P5347_01175 [Smithellaceae bacterium]|nr:hypothetical protein [Smithellaceae bacterium]